MEFAAASPSTYKATQFPGQPDANFQVASNVGPGQSTAFKLTGEGALTDQQEEGGQSQGQATTAQNESRPGGGLGPPIDAPPPTQKYQWWILGGLAVALVFGGVYVASRQQASHRTARAKVASTVVAEEDEIYEFAPAPTREIHSTPLRTAAVEEYRPPKSMLLEALKEELFELEVEHKQGRISHEEYEKAKAALDQTLERALKREAQKA
jgi:hypothetical protein